MAKKKKPSRPAKKRSAKKRRAAAKPAKKKSSAKPVRLVPAAKPDARRRRGKSLIRRAGESALRPMARLMRLGGDKYDVDLERNPANYQPLTPLSFLERAASVFPTRTAIIHGKQRFSYADYYARARRLASALAKSGIKKGDTVAVMLANTPPMLEAH